MSVSSPTPLTFATLGLAEPVLRAVTAVGYEAPSPIQAASIPPLLAGRDIVGQAQTGTGKTAAFALPLLSRIDLSLSQPQVLILTPTRELALQVSEALQTYARYLEGFHVLPVYGGQSMFLQLRQLRRGVHVIVGTPGRVMDHLRRQSLVLDNLRCLVLDEADEMLRMGFIEDVEWILQQTPPQRQIALFSATMPDAIRTIAKRHLRDPAEIKIHNKTATVSTTTQYYWEVTPAHKLDALTRLLESHTFDAMLIFVRTRIATSELVSKLEARGYTAAALSGEMAQAHREKTIERLKNGDLDIVVATDVAARGLDVERISHVVNYDIPNDTETYVHRIGRTGRAGRSGAAVLFVAPREKRLLQAIEKATRQPMSRLQFPSQEDLTNRKVEQFKQQITDTLAAQDLEFFTTLVEQYRAQHATALEDIAAALAYLVQRERPLVPVRTRHPTSKREEAADAPPDDATASERPSRSRSKPPRSLESDPPEPGKIRYRLEVGRAHGVQPKHIVGAIANEVSLDSRHIGQIVLYDDYSTVELPEGMPQASFQHLRNVWVCSRKLNITPASPGGEAVAPDTQHDEPAPRKPRRSTIKPDAKRKRAK